MKILRSLPKLCLRIGLIGINVVLISFLARSLWLEPLIGRLLEEQASAYLHAEVKIGSVHTNLWNNIVVEGIQISGSDSSLVTGVEGGSITAALSLPELLEGDLRGLRFARVHANKARLQLDTGSTETGNRETGSRETAPSIDALVKTALDLNLTDIGSSGIQVTATEFELVTPLRVRRGSLDILLSPGSGLRDLGVRLGHDFSAEFQLKGGSSPHVSGKTQVSALADVLQDAGMETNFEAGRATGFIHADLNRKELYGDLVIDAFEIKHTKGSAKISFLVKPTSIFVDTLSADLKGLDIEGSNIMLPGPSNWGPDWLASCRGGLHVEINDLSPYTGILPEAVVDLMPIAGRLNAWLDRDTLRLGRGTLHGKDTRIDFDEGRLPVHPDRKGAAEGYLSFHLSVDKPHSFDLPDGSKLSATGDVHGRVDGSLQEPRFHTAVNLAAGTWRDYTWEGLSANASFDNFKLSLHDIEARGVRLTSGTRPSTAKGDVEVSFEPDKSITVTGRIQGAISPDCLLPLNLPTNQTKRLELDDLILSCNLELQGKAIPLGVVTADIRGLRIDGRKPTDLHIESSSELAAGTGRNIKLELDGIHVDAGWLAYAGLDPVDLDRITPGHLRVTGDVILPPVGQPRGTASLSLTEATIDATQPFTVRGSCAIDQDNLLTIKELRVTGLVPCTAEGSLPLQPGIPGDLHAIIDHADLKVLTTLLRLPVLPGQATGSLRIHGRLDTPNADVDLRVKLLRPLQHLPPHHLPTADLARISDNLNLELKASLLDGTLAIEKIRAILGKTFQLQASGMAPFSIAASGLKQRTGTESLRGRLQCYYDLDQHPLDLDTEFEWTAAQLALSALTIKSKDGIIRGNAFLPDLATAISKRADILALPVHGKLTAEAFDLRSIPVGWIDVPILKGTIEANIELAGTLGQPEPNASFTMRNGLVKLASGIPAMHELSLDAKLTKNTITLQSLSATVGAGKLECKGTFNTKDKDLIRGFEQGLIDFKLTGEDVLAYRKTGIRIRANADITARGTPSKVIIGGQVFIRNSKLVRRATLLPDLSRRGIGSTDFKISKLTLPPELGNRLHFDLSVQTAPNQPLAIRTHVLDADVESSLHLGGTGTSPLLKGVISTRKGFLRLPAVGFSVDSAVISCNPIDIDRPDVTINASGRRHGFDIKILVTGKLDNLEINLTSSPALPPNDLLVLVSTGVLPSTLSSQGIEGNVTLVGGYLFQEIADFYFGNDSTDREGGLASRIHFESGRDVSEDGVSSVIIEFDLVKERFKLQAERDKFEEYNMGILYRIRF